MIQKLLTHFKNDSLFRNSAYLMASTAIMSGLGFLYWIVAARLFTPQQIGLGTTLISITSLITSFSLLGLGSGLVKYLPTSTDKSTKVNTAITVTSLTTLFVTLLFLLFINQLTPEVAFISKSWIAVSIFTFFTILYSVNILMDDVFVAYRKALYVLIKNSVFSLVKLLLLFVLSAYGAMGIFNAFGLGTTLAVVVSLALLIYKLELNFRPQLNKAIILKIAKFSAGNYLSLFMSGLPARLLPLLITTLLGAHYSAYFFIDMMVVNLLFVIPSSVSQSLFAEGSYSETGIQVHLNKSIKLIATILIPGVITIILLGKYFLGAFGTAYAIEGTQLLQILSISGIFVAINYVGDALLKLRHRVRLMVVINTINALAVLIFSYLLSGYGLSGIGVAVVLGNAIASVLYLYHLRKVSSVDTSTSR